MPICDAVHAHMHWKKMGPRFGGADLCIGQQFDRLDSCSSNFPNRYMDINGQKCIETGSKRDLLVGTDKSYAWAVKEIEVFQISF